MTIATERHTPPLYVRLPESMNDFFSGQEYTSPCMLEHRTSARLRVRCKSTLEILSSPPFVKRDEKLLQVLIKDISKNGIGIVSHLQIFPLECFTVELMGRKVEAIAARCSRIGEFCFEVGARIERVSSSEKE